MRTPDFNESLLCEHVDQVDSVDVKRAAATLTQHAERAIDIQCGPGMQGVIRTFGYHVDGERAFAFIFNKTSLLFYVRKPALAWITTGPVIEAARGARQLDIASNAAGEITVRVISPAQAKRVNETLIDPIVDAHSRRTSIIRTNMVTPMIGPIYRPAALVRQGGVAQFSDRYVRQDNGSH